MAKTDKTFILSDSSKINSKGYRVDANGIELERFKANPVMLYRHNPGDVIGRWEDIQVVNGKLSAVPVFDLEDEVGKKISGKVDRGFLKAASIGLVPLELDTIDGVLTVTKCEIMEASIVPVPADAGATVLYDENHNELDIEKVKLQFNYKPSNFKKMDDKEKKELEATISEKEKKIAELEEKIKKTNDDAVAAYLSGAVTAGKITEAEKASYAKLAAADFDSVKAVIESKEAKPSATLADLAKKASTGEVAGRESWDYLQWMKEDSAGLKRMKTENPAAFERLKQTLEK